MIVTILLLIVATVSAVPLGAEQKWNNFKLAHNKVYDTRKEEIHRFNIFLENLQEIEEHNAKYEAGETSWYMGINQFSDMTTEEFEQVMDCSDLPEDSEVTETDVEDASEPIGYVPNELDYTAYFNPARNQGNYATCYAFSAVAAIEAYRYRAGYQKQIFSVQDIVDCSKGPPYNNNGSWTGYRRSALMYVRDKGAMLDRDYPYTGYESKNPSCRHDDYKVQARISSFKLITNTEANLKQALYDDGPITLSISSKEWNRYRGGIFTPTIPFNRTNHAVVLVGYGTTRDTYEDYWIVRNSWGPTWGESGNIRVTRQVRGSYHIGIAGPRCKVGDLPVL